MLETAPVGNRAEHPDDPIGARDHVPKGLRKPAAILRIEDRPVDLPGRTAPREEIEETMKPRRIGIAAPAARELPDGLAGRQQRQRSDIAEIFSIACPVL